MCVDDDWSKCWRDPRTVFTALPKRGVVYVVRDVRHALNGELGITLVGITNFQSVNDKWAVFYPHRFRRLDEMRAESKTLQEAQCS